MTAARSQPPTGGLAGDPQAAREVVRALRSGGHGDAGRRAPGADPRARVPRRPDPASAPLSPEQEGLWFIEQLDNGAGAYNAAKTVRLTGPLDVGLLRLALHDVVDRHEALRTRIVERHGQPVQLVTAAGDPSVRPELEVDDLTACQPAERASRAEQVTAERVARPFALDSAPLLRVSVVLLGEDESLMLVTAHHLICDGQALTLVVEELGACYAARASGQEPALPALRLHFPDYAAWQRARLAGELGERQREYWATQLAGAPELLDLPTDRPRPAEQSFSGGRCSFEPAADLAERLRWFAAGQRCTAPMVLLAALYVVLTRYSGQTDVIVGMPVNRRTRELQRAVGMFANTVALRADISGNPTVRELLARVRRVCMGAFENADLPFDEAAAAARHDRSLSHNPLFQVMLVPGEAAYDGIAQPGTHRLRGQELQMDRSTAVVDLTWVVTVDDLRSHVDYNTDLFDEATADRLGRHLRQTLAAMIADADRRLWNLPVLADAELATLAGFGSTAGGADGADRCVVESFVRQAAETPDAAAVLSVGAAAAVDTDPDRISYGELERRSRSVAHRLVGLGHGRGDRIGLLLPTGIDAVVALLGVLRAGAAYVPLDPAHPPARLGELLADSGATALITRPADAGLVPTFTGTCLTTDDPAIGPAAAAADQHDALPAVVGDQLAYVVYTSGSTGEPKGVMVEHGSLRNLVAAVRHVHAVDADQRSLLIPPLSFDASVGGLFPALASGAGVVLHLNPVELTGHDVLRLCRELHITVLNSSSPMWQRWVADLDGQAQPPTPLTQVILGGDRVPWATVDSWAAATGGAATVFNHYGPTEATVCATIMRLAPGAAGAAPGADAGGRPRTGTGHLPIGRPLPGVTAHVLDDAMGPAPIGVPGELYLGGAAPARGYLGRPAATAERFVPDPFSGVPGARLYRTGDLARFRPDGRLEFVGRRDGQVKIRGHRVETAAVEAALAAHPLVREVAVVAQPDRAGLDQLVAYLVVEPAGGEDTAPAALRAFALTTLPDYMAPSAFVHLDRLPVTSHGKLDTAALPLATELLADRPFVAPRSDTERRLAAIWAEVLDCGPVGATDNFFQLGGHSLLAAKLASRISAELGVRLPIRSLFDTTDLAELATRLDDRPAAAATVPATVPDLRAAALLPADVCADLRDADPERALRPAHALLTGATGFLGAYLLADLLTNTEATVHCLVRAGSVEQAGGRLRAGLERYGLWRPEYAHRVAGLPGDLAAPRLGLTDARFDELADQLDVIFHCGATVHSVHPYRVLAPTNVDGTVEVLRLAGHGRTTPVHVVSTLGVYLGSAHAGIRVAETDEPADPHGLDSGYEQSKWVSDALVRQARARGLPVSIHRPARIAGAASTGAANPDDYFSRLVRTVVQLGLTPVGDALADADRYADLAPVDHVAAGIGALSRMPRTLGRDFHFYNSRTMSVDRFTAALREYGYEVSEVRPAEWLAAVTGSDNPLSPFLTGTESSPPASRPQFDCRATEALLADVGLVCPAADGALLHRYLDAFVERGYLPAPR